MRILCIVMYLWLRIWHSNTFLHLQFPSNGNLDAHVGKYDLSIYDDDPDFDECEDDKHHVIILVIVIVAAAPTIIHITHNSTPRPLDIESTVRGPSSFCV